MKSKKTRNDIVLELTNDSFFNLIQVIQDLSSTEELANERLLALRDQLIKLETYIIKQSVRTNTL